VANKKVTATIQLNGGKSIAISDDWEQFTVSLFRKG
jgi:hypothetical protein